MMRTIVALCLGVTICSAALGQHKDEQAIRQAVEKYVAAYNKQDAKAMASMWAADGQYVSRSAGSRVLGRQAIEDDFQQMFSENVPGHLSVSIDSLRFLADGVAVEEGTATVVQAGQLPSRSTYTAIHVKRDGVWMLESVRETDLPSPPSHFSNLAELQWMIGEWVDGSEGAKVETVCQWTKNHNFITRTFTVKIEDRIDSQGTQVIGWDAAEKQIRSWVFDSQGGFSEGVWSRDGNRWVVKANGVLPDGGRASAVQIISFVDANTFTWQSVAREVDGQLLPNVDPVTVVRKSNETEKSESPPE